MRLWTAMTTAVALLGALAAPAQAGDLPPPTVRSSNGTVRRAAPVRRAPTRATPSRAAATPRPARVHPKPALPYRAPARHRDALRQATLPISGPSQTASNRTRTYVPPLPGNWVDARPKTAAPSRTPARRAAPACTTCKRRAPSTTSVPALPAPTVRGPVAQVAPAPRRLVTTASTRTRRSTSSAAPRSRTIVRRATPRRRAVRRGSGSLTVPCAPGQKAPVAPVRRSLELVRPPGVCDT